eukprot:Skav202335  [mRNA]  locus=scaffold781:75324:76640:+ [translate_table: standard]
MPTAPQGHCSQGCMNQQSQQAHAWHYNQGMPATMQPPAVQTQGVESPMQTLPAQTQFVPLDPDKSKAVPHKPPHVGLHNTNNTCYMNSFTQALCLTDTFVWRTNSFNLKLKENSSKMDKEDFEFGKRVVDFFQKHFAKMALTKHKHVDIWDILQGFPAQSQYRSGEQEDITETIRFVFDKLGDGDQLLLNEVFSGQLRENIQCSQCGNVKFGEETFTVLVLPAPTAKEIEQSGIVFRKFPNGDNASYTMDDSQIKPADASVMAGFPPGKMKDDNAYVLFLRCKQAPPTPEFRVPNSLVDYVKKEDKKQ